MNLNAAYREVGSYRAAATPCGTTPKTVKRGHRRRRRRSRCHRDVRLWPNYDIVAERVAKTKGLISAKRVLPTARAAGYVGSARNFRRLVAKTKRSWRADRGRRPGVWALGDMLVIDWGQIGRCRCSAPCWPGTGCASCASPTTSEPRPPWPPWPPASKPWALCRRQCSATAWGCLKGGTVAGVVVPTADYVRFANHYSFRPDLCQGADPNRRGWSRTWSAT